MATGHLTHGRPGAPPTPPTPPTPPLATAPAPANAPGTPGAPGVAAGRDGGDLHATADTPYGLRLLIGDVRGKGPEAAGGANALLGAFRTAAHRAPTLHTLVDMLEQAMLRHTSRREGPLADEHFASVVAAELSPVTGVLRLLNRGHPAPLLLRPGLPGHPSGHGTVRALKPVRPGLPLGLRALAPARGAAGTVALAFPEDATLLLMTDGTTEARDARGAFYDPVRRLAPYAASTPAELVRHLRRDVHAHTDGHVRDDMAVLAMRPSRARAAASRWETATTP
ncbi:PP2C family protein-serine/threonine phosphatase [Streptomyces daliensis]